MGLSSFFRRFSSKAVDSAVGFADGKTPVAPLETSASAYRTVIIVALVVLVGSGSIFWTNIRRISRVLHPKAPNVNTSESAQITALKTKDTDHDGLSDYDELFYYKSSPYLFSTAGDGVSDGTKVAKGENPSCAENTTCNPTPTVNVNTDTNSTLTPDFLRSALKAAGVAQSTLDNTNDADLLAIYTRVVGQTSKSNTNTNVVPNVTVSDLQKLSGNDIRSLLEANGISATTLSTVDDTTLQQIFQQVITTDSNTNSSSTPSNVN